jgi:CheY-like chemotaxis protein
MKSANPHTILVVDDSTTNVILLEAILSEKGYEIVTSLNAKEAYTVLKRQIVDLILLDLLMPKISGLDFLEEIKKNDQTKDIPVIIVSALSDKESEEKAMKMGAVGFVCKPIDIQSFTTMIANLLN